MPRIPHNTTLPTLPMSPLHRCKACDYCYCLYYFEPKSNNEGLIHYSAKRKLPKEKKQQTRVKTTELVEELVTLNRECRLEKAKNIELAKKLISEETKDILNLCPICMDSEVNHALSCGHCYCEKCSDKFETYYISRFNTRYNCPTCSLKYQSRIKIYL